MLQGRGQGAPRDDRRRPGQLQCTRTGSIRTGSRDMLRERHRPERPDGQARPCPGVSSLFAAVRRRREFGSHGSRGDSLRRVRTAAELAAPQQAIAVVERTLTRTPRFVPSSLRRMIILPRGRFQQHRRYRVACMEQDCSTPVYGAGQGTTAPAVASSTRETLRRAKLLDTRGVHVHPRVHTDEQAKCCAACGRRRAEWASG